MRLKRPKKIERPQARAIDLFRAHRVIFSEHALLRMQQRRVSQSDIESVLDSGFHIPKRDEYSEAKGWSYCFEGLDFDKERKIRLAVGITNAVVVITVIDLGEIK